MTPELEKRIQEALDAGADLTEDEVLAAELSAASAEREANELATVDGWLRDLASLSPNDDELASLRNRLSTFDSVLPDVPDVTAPPVFEEELGAEGTRAAALPARASALSARAAQSAGPAAVAVAAEREREPSRRGWIPIALAAACVGLFVGAGTMFMAQSSSPMAAMEQDVSVAAETSALSPSAPAPVVAPAAAAPTVAPATVEAPDERADEPSAEEAVPTEVSEVASRAEADGTAALARGWEEEPTRMAASMASMSSVMLPAEPRRRRARRRAPQAIQQQNTPRARPSDADVRDVIRRVAPGIRGCTSAAVRVRVHVLGASGRIDETEIRTPLNATQSECVRQVIRTRARFPEFSSDSWTELRFPGR